MPLEVGELTRTAVLDFRLVSFLHPFLSLVLSGNEVGFTSGYCSMANSQPLIIFRQSKYHILPTNYVIEFLEVSSAISPHV